MTINVIFYATLNYCFLLEIYINISYNYFIICDTIGHLSSDRLK